MITKDAVDICHAVPTIHQYGDCGVSSPSFDTANMCPCLLRMSSFYYTTTCQLL